MTDSHWTDLFETIRKTVMIPVNPAGWPFIAGFAAASVILMFLTPVLGWTGVVLTVWCFYFFRDPLRVTPAREGLVISPACGTVTMIVPDMSLPPELDSAMDHGPNFTRISIFLSVFDVHVNRVPVDGKIVQTAYRPGKFLNAALDKASLDNEMSATLMKIEDGKTERDVAFVQIAGWVARRIINHLVPGQVVKAGQRMGLIRFGSRVDVYVPEDAAVMVCVGQSAIEGETVLADLKGREKSRIGEVR